MISSFLHRIWLLSIKKLSRRDQRAQTETHLSGPPSDSVPPDSTALIWRLINRIFGHKLGTMLWIVIALILLVITPARDLILPAIKIIVASISERLPIPKALPGRYTVAVAHLNNDPDGKYEALILEDLQTIKWVDTLQVNRTIPLEPNRFHESPTGRFDIAKVHQYLKDSGAQILVWGSVLRSDQSSVPDLLLSPSDASDVREGRFRLREDLNLPDLFWSELADLLYVEVATQFINSLHHEIEAENIIKLAVTRLQRLLNDSQQQPGWSEKTRANFRYLIAQMFGMLGFTTGKAEYYTEDIVICNTLLEVYQHRPNDLDRIDYLQEKADAETRLAETDQGDAAVDMLSRAIVGLRLALESIDSATKAAAKESPPPVGFDIDGFIASGRASILEKLGRALESLGKLTSDVSKVRDAAIDYRNALKDCIRGKDAVLFAITMAEFGRALAQLGEKEGRTDYLVSAAGAFRMSAKVFGGLGAPFMTDEANSQLAVVLIESVGESLVRPARAICGRPLM